MNRGKLQYSVKIKALVIYQLIYVLVLFGGKYFVPNKGAAWLAVMGILSVGLAILLALAIYESIKKGDGRERGLLCLCVVIAVISIYRLVTGDV